MKPEETATGIYLLNDSHNRTGKCLNCTKPMDHGFTCSELCAEMMLEALQKSDAWYNNETLYKKLSTHQ